MLDTKHSCIGCDCSRFTPTADTCNKLVFASAVPFAIRSQAGGHRPRNFLARWVFVFLDTQHPNPLRLVPSVQMRSTAKGTVVLLALLVLFSNARCMMACASAPCESSSGYSA